MPNRSEDERAAALATEPDFVDTCAICGRELWSDGLAPAQDGSAWICGDCDQARNFGALDL